MKRLVIRRALTLVVAVVALSVGSFAQTGSKKKLVLTEDKKGNITPGTAVLATVGGDPITLGDLEAAYKRNMVRKNSVLTKVRKDSVMDFLNLYVKYRLKVKDAVSRGFDKDSAVMAEVASNRRILAENYLLDKKVIEPNLTTYLERRKKELQVAVMVMVIPQGENADTMAAYTKAMKCIQLVKNGGDFLAIAKDSSEDKETRERGGLLPYFTSLGGIIRQLEDAAYTLKSGELYPVPVRSRYVYLVVKSIGESPRTLVRASQILVPTYDGEDSTAAIRRADSLAAALRSQPRTAFGDAARAMSTDKTSGAQGGDLMYYYSRSLGFENDNHRLIPEFEEKMFSLKDGEIGTIQTLYGAHVIRRDSTKQTNIEEERDNVKKIYKKYYFEDDKRAYLEKTKKERGYVVDEAVMNEMITEIGSGKNTTDTTWYKGISEGTKAKALFRSPNRTITVSGMIDSLRKRTDMRGSSLNKQGLTNALNKIADPLVISESAGVLENEYADFSALIKEFRDGILLFKVEEQEVWLKLKFDTTVARAFWDSTKTKYYTETKYDVSEIYSLTDTTAKKSYDLVMRSPGREAFEAQAELLTQRDGYREKKGRWGLLSIKNSKLAQAVDAMKPAVGDILGPLKFEKGYSIVRVNDVQSPRMKTFEEAIPDFAPAYQDMMQKKFSEAWIARLKEKYPVIINQSFIDVIFRNQGR
jgi:peptidyl-prolyl cis-trans isomerase SurA